jgi:alanyl-tRNA synthetase
MKKVASLLEKNKSLDKQIQSLENKLASNTAKDLWSNVQVINNVTYLFEIMPNVKIDSMRAIVDSFKDKYDAGIVVLANHNEDNKIQLICSVAQALTSQIKAGDIIRDISGKISGKGGGRPDFAQGGGVSEIKNLNQVFDDKLNELKNLINNE